MIRCLMAVMLAIALTGAVLAEGEPVAVTANDAVYSLNTVAGVRAEIRTAADYAKVASLWRKEGEAVTAVAPDGTASTLAAADAAGDSVGWTPTAGGLWTLTDSVQGSAQFSVRHSIFGTLGNGTEASPAKLVDEDELTDYAAGDGYVFTLDGADGLLGRLRLPSGFRLEEAGAGAYRIVSSPDGCVYAWSAADYRFDSKQSGPNRKIAGKATPGIAYSGDDWNRGATAPSLLTLTTPSGVRTEHSLTGTDLFAFAPQERGDWLVSLEADGQTLDAVVSVVPDGFILSFR